MSTSTQSQTNSASAFKLECRKFLFLRCWRSIILTLFLQIELLVLFLLAVNFDLLHPVAWIKSVIARLFSIFTWLAIIPLLIAVLAQLLVLLKYNVTARQYYNKRFKWLAATVTLKFLFLCLQMSIGCLSALYYARFLHMDYSQMTSDCFGAKCLNSYYTYLLLLGLTTGCYHFVREYARKSPDLEFAIIQEYKFVKLRSTLYTQIQRALMSFVLPLVCFTFAYWLLSGIINRQIASFFKVELDFNMGSIISVFCNVRLLFYGWILAASILSNMQVMQSIACIVMTEEVDFVIERDPLLKHNAEITLAECISMTELPLIQTLAALNLYNISLSKAKAARRQELFRLSVPGGHPYNWNQLSTQCLAVLNNFTAELVGASKNISTSNTVPLYQNYDANDKHAAEKILLRQYNLMHGIRDLTAESQYKHDNKEHQTTSGNKYLHERIINHFEHFSEQLVNSILRVVYSVPGMHYIFAEEEGARVAFLLSNSQAIVWIAQGLAGVCSASLTEDKYGVVQDVLPDIIKSLLKLKLELDKLNNVNLNGKKLDRSFYVLKQALKRSLYKISDAFGNYMCDLLNNPDDIRQMQGFLNYQEI